MSFDPELPELHEHDPRLCAGHHWLPEEQRESFQHPHDWSGFPRCIKCGLAKDDLRRRFAEWRFEMLIERNTEALCAIGLKLDDISSDVRAIPTDGWPM